MAPARFFLLALGTLAAACARPDHRPAPLPPPPPGRAPARDVALARPEIRVAILESGAVGGSGNWGDEDARGGRFLGLTPAPSTLVASCLEPGAVGWLSVELEWDDGRRVERATVVEASPDVAPRTRECIRTALAGLHSERALDAVYYVTFSPAP